MVCCPSKMDGGKLSYDQSGAPSLPPASPHPPHSRDECHSVGKKWSLMGHSRGTTGAFPWLPEGTLGQPQAVRGGRRGQNSAMRTPFGFKRFRVTSLGPFRGGKLPLRGQESPSRFAKRVATEPLRTHSVDNVANQKQLFIKPLILAVGGGLGRPS